MIQFRCDAKALIAAFWDSVLFTAKVGVAEGKVLFSMNSQGLNLFVTDDFVALKIHVDGVSEDESQQFAVLVADVKRIEARVRGAGIDDETTITLDAVDNHVALFGEVVTAWYPSEVWSEITEIVETEWPAGSVASDHYVNPKRLAQFTRMKTPGDQPMGIRPVLDQDAVLWAFVLGPNVKGVISSMDEDTLRSNNNWMWGDHYATEPQTERPTSTPQVSIEDQIFVTEEDVTVIEDVPWDDSYEVETHQIELTQDMLDQEADLQGVRAKDYQHTRVQYTDAVDSSVTPDHVERADYEKFGY